MTEQMKKLTRLYEQKTGGFNYTHPATVYAYFGQRLKTTPNQCLKQFLADTEEGRAALRLIDVAHEALSIMPHADKSVHLALINEINQSVCELASKAVKRV